MAPSARPKPEGTPTPLAPVAIFTKGVAGVGCPSRSF